jgi:hypothetical protein
MITPVAFVPGCLPSGSIDKTMAERASPSAVRMLESLTFCFRSCMNTQNCVDMASANIELKVATPVSCRSGSLDVM